LSGSVLCCNSYSFRSFTANAIPDKYYVKLFPVQIKIKSSCGVGMYYPWKEGLVVKECEQTRVIDE
jgi:hypothetical protein